MAIVILMAVVAAGCWRQRSSMRLYHNQLGRDCHKRLIKIWPGRYSETYPVVASDRRERSNPHVLMQEMAVSPP
jgi:hypothetical protein